MADVFISYSRSDSDFVRILDAQLRSEERDVWVDWEDIAPADDWQQDIYDNIDAAENFVFVVSAKSLQSEYCGKELARAAQGGKKIIPIACDSADPDLAPAALGTPNWIWCADGDDRTKAFEKLAAAIETDLAWTKAHTRLLVRAVEWETRKDGSLLLRGADLRVAEENLEANVGKQPEPTELQQRYVLASRRAATRRQRIMLGSAGVALAVAIGLGILALLQRNDARAATRSATSVASASAANDRAATHPDQALLLALAAYESAPSAQARDAVVTALEQARKLGIGEFLHGSSPVESVAFAPDGRTLAVGSDDGAVRLWDVRSRREISTLAPPVPRKVVAVAFAQHGRALAVADAKGTVRLWDVRSGDVVRTLRARGPIFTAAVSEDGDVVAAAAQNVIWIWSRARGWAARRDRLPGAGALAFSPDGRKLAVGTVVSGGDVAGAASGEVALFAGASGAPLGVLPGQDPIGSVAFSSDGRIVAGGGWHVGGPAGDAFPGEIQLWNARTRARIGRVKSGPTVDSVTFLGSGRTVIAQRDDGSIRPAAPLEGKWIGASSRPVTGGAGAFAVGGGGRMVAFSASGDGTVRVVDRHDPVLLGRTIAAGSPSGVAGYTSISFGSGGRSIAAADPLGGRVRMAAAATGIGGTPRWLGNDKIAQYVLFSPTGQTLAVLNDDGSLKVWNVRTHTPIVRLPGSPNATPDALAFDRTGELLAAADSEDVRVRDVRHPGHDYPALPAHRVVAMEFLGRTLVTVAEEGRVQLWNIDRGTRAGPMLRPVPSAQAAAFSPDGRTIVFADNNDNVWLWGPGERGPATRVALAKGSSVAVSGDGRTLAVADERGQLRLFDLSTQLPLGPPLSAPDFEGPAGIAFSPDGTTLAVAGGAVRLWAGILWTDLTELRARVCRLVLGGFTPDEWNTIEPGVPMPHPCP